MRLLRVEVRKENGPGVKLDSLIHVRYTKKCGSWLSGRCVVTFISPKKELRRELDFITMEYVESSEYRKFKAFCFGPKLYKKVGTAWAREAHEGYLVCN
jgi:hypothetical protein